MVLSGNCQVNYIYSEYYRVFFFVVVWLITCTVNMKFFKSKTYFNE